MSAETTNHPACNQCRFWDRALRHDWGRCRRNAPRAVQWAETQDEEERQGESDAVWPGTGEDDWCGEFEVKR